MADEVAADQAPQQSVEDRIYAQFADNYVEADKREEAPQESPAEEAEQETPPESDEVEIEFDGERYKVPKKLEKGFMQERDYTQKSQALAETRRNVEQAQARMKVATLEQEFHKSVSDEVRQIDQIENYIKQLRNQDFNSMSAEDGFRQWMQIQQYGERQKELQASVDKKRDDFQKQADKAFSELKANVRDSLTKSIPGFSDDSHKAMKGYAEKAGFTDVDFESISMDARASSLLFKAMRFDELSQKAQKVAVDTPALKPKSSNPMPDSVKQKLALNKAFKGAKTRQEREAINQRRIEALFS